MNRFAQSALYWMTVVILVALLAMLFATFVHAQRPHSLSTFAVTRVGEMP